MKRILLCLPVVFMVFFAQSIIAQNNKTIPNSFVIIDNNKPDQLEFYTKSIQAADMEKFRLKNDRIKLQFDNGFTLELFS